MHKTKNILFLALGFMVVGFITVFLTHQPIVSNDLVNQEKYIEHIQPWIDTFYIDQSLDSISSIKSNFLDFKSSDRSIGPAHLSLFLAFDAWERFLLTGDDNHKEQIIKNFSSAIDMLPELDLSIKEVKNILEQQNV